MFVGAKSRTLCSLSRGFLLSTGLYGATQEGVNWRCHPITLHQLSRCLAHLHDAQTPSPTHLLWCTLIRSDIGKLFASAGDDQLAVMIHVPAAIAEKLSVKEWAETVAKDVGLEVNSIEGEFAKVGV